MVWCTRLSRGGSFAIYNLICRVRADCCIINSTVNLLDFKGKLFGLVFNVSCCLLRSLQFDPLFPITHPHTITLLHALLYYVHCLSHVRSHDGRYYSDCDTIMISLLIMNNELEPHTLRVYDPEDHFS